MIDIKELVQIFQFKRNTSSDTTFPQKRINKKRGLTLLAE